MARKKTKAKISPTLPTREKSVAIKRAVNGLVVSTWVKGEERLFIAKTRKEAKQIANKILG